VPALKLPPNIVELLRRPNPAVIACVRPDGFPMTVATWYDWDDGLVLVNIYGLVVAFRDDTDLADIDRLSRRYGGAAFRERAARRVSAWIEPHGWHVWDPSGELTS
jgi:hypothetical protein